MAADPVRAIAGIVADLRAGPLSLFWELPLRAITGRRRPDYDRIAALEAELGYAPKPALTFISPPISYCNIEEFRLRFLAARDRPPIVLP